MDEHQLARAAERLSRTLTSEELDETLRRVTRGAVAHIPAVHHASITVRHADGRLETVAPTDAVAAHLDREQLTLEQGPCYEAAHGRAQVVSTDLEHEERFAKYAETAVRAGIRAQAALRLFALEDGTGALNLYSREPGAFADVTELAELFALQSAAALEHARELELVRAAAHDSELVGKAVGITMERYALPEQGAFALLTRLAGHHEVELPKVAVAIVAASDERAD